MASSMALLVAGCADGAAGEDNGAFADVPAPITGATPSPQNTTGFGPQAGAAGTAGTAQPTPSGQDGAAPAAGEGTGMVGSSSSPTPPPAEGTPDTVTPPPPGSGVMESPPTPTAPGSSDPVIPPVTADCPAFRNGTITFMGLPGIEIVAGAKPPGPTAPMVFYWHGTGGSAGEYAFQAGAVRDGVVAEGGVLVSFQGTTGGDLLSGTFIFGAGDFDLVDQLVACAVRDHNVDPRRIYATGCSAGGLFSTAMAASRSNYVAAAAPNSGGLIGPLAFQNGYTPALMTIHGAAGRDVVVVDFSVTSATADASFKDHGGFVINCDHGGGHCGGGGFAGDIWKFFKAHPYGVDPAPWTSGLPAGFNAACQIY